MSIELIHGDCLIEMPRLIERGVKVEACKSKCKVYIVPFNALVTGMTKRNHIIKRIRIIGVVAIIA